MAEDVVISTRRGIYGKLAGDTTLNAFLATPPAGWSKSIFYQFAPEGADFPYVIFSLSATTPTWAIGNGGTAAYDEEIWQIKGVARRTSTHDTADTVEAINARVDTLLSGATLSLSGRTSRYLRREGPGIDFAEVVDGVLYRHSGADFRFITN